MRKSLRFGIATASLIAAAGMMPTAAIAQEDPPETGSSFSADEMLQEAPPVANLYGVDLATDEGTPMGILGPWLAVLAVGGAGALGVVVTKAIRNMMQEGQEPDGSDWEGLGAGAVLSEDFDDDQAETPMP